MKPPINVNITMNMKNPQKEKKFQSQEQADEGWSLCWKNWKNYKRWKDSIVIDDFSLMQQEQ